MEKNRSQTNYIWIEDEEYSFLPGNLIFSDIIKNY
jgi:hypothetical protein